MCCPCKTLVEISQWFQYPKHYLIQRVSEKLFYTPDTLSRARIAEGNEDPDNFFKLEEI